jgi:hypothetical protein
MIEVAAMDSLVCSGYLEQVNFLTYRFSVAPGSVIVQIDPILMCLVLLANYPHKKNVGAGIGATPTWGYCVCWLVK